MPKGMVAPEGSKGYAQNCSKEAGGKVTTKAAGVVTPKASKRPGAIAPEGPRSREKLPQQGPE